MRSQFRAALALVAGALLLALVMLPPLGRAAQNTLSLPTTGVFNGLAEQNSINNALNALNTCNAGSSAPTNQLGGVPVEGQCWVDTTSSTLKILKRYTGSGWVVQGILDVTNGLWVPPVGGGMGAVNSATTTDLCASPQAVQTVSGTTTITSFGSNCVAGSRKTLIFSGALTLTWNATSMILPGGVSITTAAGDVAEAIALGGSNWRVVNYVPLAGTVVNSIAGRTGLLTLSHGLVNSSNDLQIDVASIANHLSGLEMSTAGGSATFSVAIGAATDSTNADFIKLTSAISKTTSAWAVGSGNGGLDTGGIAINTWYHVFLIKRPDTGVVDVLISTSATSPTMPTNYTLKRRIGSIKTSGSSQWIAFLQFGDDFLWLAPPQDIATTTLAAGVPTTFALGGVPTGVKVFAHLTGVLSNAANGTQLLIQSAEVTSAGPSQATGLITARVQAAGLAVAFTENIRTNASAQVVAYADQSSTTLNVSTKGFTDYRGK